MKAPQRKLDTNLRPEPKIRSQGGTPFPEGTVAEARILCCPVIPHPAAMEALEKYAPQADIVPLNKDDTYGYWREIRTRWTGEQDLILIEQDIEIREDTITSLERCTEPWCVFAYTIFRRKVRLRVGLGCTKISASAQQTITARDIAEGFTLCRECKGQGCWWHLDGRISGMLKKAGYSPHEHGDVTHHHDYHAQAADKKQGWPIEWFFEEDTDQSPARRVISEAIELAVTPRQATMHATELADLMEAVAADPSLAVPIPEDDPCYPQLLDGFPSSLGAARLPHGFPEAKAFETDKVAQGYMTAYREISDYLGPAARVCEIGVLNGGSLATWQNLFPQGTIAGVDCKPGMHWPDGTIKIVTNQDDPALPDLLTEHEFEWDLIVDDASHDGDLTARTLELLWPLVSPGGFYVIEDWFVGFDDYRGPCKSPAMLPLVQSLLCRLHADGDVASIGYRYGMAIMRKKT